MQPVHSIIFLPLILACPEEDTLKLRSGAKDGEGLVLVCREGEWKRVCDNDEGWTKEDAIVTCRQLQYPHPECK